MSAPGAEPRGWLFVLHGVFGSGKNWRLFMRRVCEARPDVGFVLVDLRGHGRSPSCDPPHDLAAAAADLVALEQALPLPMRGVVGHSLGGKIALVYARARGALEQVWVLDSQPGARAEAATSPTMQVVALLDALPESFPDRAGFVRAVEQGGRSRMLADWLAMSVRRSEDGRYRLVIDRGVARALLEDHFRRDLWSALAALDGAAHLVVAERSFVWTPEDFERLASLSGVHVHRLPEAGHWLHVDAPEALRDLFVQHL